MYRILIADDEPIVLSGLQAYLPWEDHDCTVVGTARNGKQTLEKIRQLQPDIVLLDVTMPAGSGLDVLEQISREYPEIVCIMLTNYSDFEKVRSAMLGKAVDYLLKIDLNEETLAASLSRAIEEREQRRTLYQLRREAQTEQADAEKNRKMQIARWVTRLLTAEGGDPAQAVQELMQLHCGENSALVEMYVAPGTPAEALETTPADRQRQQRFAFSLIEELTEKAFYNVGHVLIPRESTMWLYLWDLNHLSSLSRFQTRLNSALAEVAMQQVHFLVTQIRSAQELPALRMQLAVLEAEYASDPKPFLQYTSALDKAGYILAAKRYVESHVMERITVQQVSEAIGITPNYLSSIFKRQLGQNFVDYVNEQKMERACMLLESGQYMVYMISRMLGYDSAYYFAKVFKKHKHMTPTEWQTQKRQNA